jgi:hypothetical protein
MRSLSELQHALRDTLLGGDATAASDAVQGDGVRPSARLALYRHHVFTTLTDALATTFPVVCRLVDPRFFAYAADRYIREHPPAGACLFEYGADFAGFLAAFPATQHLPYLPDVARLEWALNRAYHADDAEPIDPEQLRAIAPVAMPRLVLHVHPSISLLHSAWPVDRIWRTNQPAPERQPAEMERTTVDLDGDPVHLEIRRVEDDAVMRRLDPGVHGFRAALAAGQTLAGATDVALAVDPSFDLVDALHDLLRDGTITGFAPAHVDTHDSKRSRRRRRRPRDFRDKESPS